MLETACEKAARRMKHREPGTQHRKREVSGRGDHESRRWAGGTRDAQELFVEGNLRRDQISWGLSQGRTREI